MANSERLRQVADLIEKHPVHYDQSDFGHFDLVIDVELGGVCGSACCVAGWASFLEREGKEHQHPEDDLVEDAGAKILGISKNHRLFSPSWPKEWFERAGILRPFIFGREIPEPEDAVTILRAMADSGEIWSEPAYE